MSIFIPPYINKAGLQTKKRAIQSGIIRPQGENLENVELRATLEKAVDDAGLNVSERMALNEAFYPDGKGFPLFKKGQRDAVINTFHKPGEISSDSFTNQLMTVEIPEDVSILKHRHMKSSKGSFQANLDNALKKLKQVLKGNM